MSRNFSSSARCFAADSPLLEGQSTFTTEAIHIPRNSAAVARAGIPADPRGAAAAPGPAVTAAITPAAPASRARRPMYVM